MIKVVKSDRDGEYYDRHIEMGQRLGPLAKFLKEHGIVSQSIMSGTSDQNGVAERRNQTLEKMV